MSSGDDDALSWDGDDDPTLTPGAREAKRPAAAPAEATLPRGWRAVGKGSAGVPTERTAEPAVIAEPMGNVALVAFGVIGGVYTLYVVGWVLGGLRLRERIQTSTGAVADVMSEAALWLGMAAPVIWFLVTLLLTRRAPVWQRFAGLAIGVVLLVPWPFVMLGVFG